MPTIKLNTCKYIKMIEIQYFQKNFQTNQESYIDQNLGNVWIVLSV